MKTIHLFKGLLVFLMLMIAASASAYDFKADGIYYNINSDKLSVSVTEGGYGYYNDGFPYGRYNGDVVIPEIVTYGGVTYRVTSIGANAFSWCDKLISITIPKSVTSISSYAFNSSPYNQSTFRNFSKVIISDLAAWCNISFGINPLVYAHNLYLNGDLLQDLVIPDGITSIGNSAFRGCSSLASITIPNSVTSIGGYAFSDCIGLKEVHINNLAAWFNISFADNTSNPLYYAHNLYWNGELVKDLVIPNSVTTIRYAAFYGCTSLTSVTIPNSVTSIGGSAFRGCTGLTSVTIPNSVTSIITYAFENCSSLASITIPNSVTAIGANAFEDCNLKKVIWLPNTPPNGYSSVQSVQHYVANKQYKSLSNVTVYPFLSSMFEADGVKYVPVSPSERTCDAISCAYDSAAANVKLGNTVSYQGISMKVNKIQPYLCYNNDRIKSIEINREGDIPEYAFFDCDSIKSISINAKTIGSSAFEGCTALETLTLKANSIGTEAFNGSATMNAANFNIEADTIGSSAFQGCTALETLTLKTNSIKADTFKGSATMNAANFNIEADTIGSSAFRGCTALETLTLKANSIEADAFNGSATMNAANFNIETETIGSSAFQGCTALETLTLKANSIGADAFKGSATKNAANFNIEAETIGSFAFQGCTALATLTLNANDIGASAFNKCNKLTTVTLGAQTKTIGEFGFTGCSKLQSIILPNSLTSLGASAFSGCSSLASVQIGTGLKKIEESTFNGCSALTTITISANIISIGNNVFKGCTNLAEVNIADRETELTLGSNGSSPLFADCKLKTVYIGGNITYGTSANEGYSPFYRNATLESVTITDKESEISVNEFYGCTALKNITMGDGVESIGNWAFSGCASLESFKFGSGMKTIGQEAFSDCTAMTSLESHTKVPPTCGANALDDINKWTCTLHVPEGTKTQYAAANQWKDFFFVEDDATGIDGVIADDCSGTDIKVENGNILIENAKGNISVYTTSGAMIQNVSANGESVRINLPAKGMYIIKTNKGAKTVAL